MSTRIAVARDRRSMRMVWKTLRFRHVGLAFFWACSMLTFRSSILLQGPANTPELETVSYTHLDVYKRQPWSTPYSGAVT